MKAKKCRLYMNTRNGYMLTPMDFDSISKALAYARGGNGAFYYQVVIGDEVVRSGFCG